MQRIASHSDDALARLAQQYKRKPNVRKLFVASCAELDRLEAVFWDLLEKRWIDGGAGEQLDGVGRIVGLEREGRADALYRVWLKAWVKLNRSGGSTPVVLEVMKTVITGNPSLRLVDRYPAGFELEVLATLTDDPSRLASILRRVRSGGVDGQLWYRLGEESATFELEPGTARATTTTARVALTAGGGSVDTQPTQAFPASGALLLSRGLGAWERFPYAYYNYLGNRSVFYGTGVLLNSHALGATVDLYAETNGLGSNWSDGGELAGAIQ